MTVFLLRKSHSGSLSSTWLVLPDEDPHITGGKPRYQIGDYVRVNCTSGRSKPAVHLTWYINSEPADHGLVRQYEPIVSGTDRLETSILGLEFRVKPKHFKRGDMKLKVRERERETNKTRTNYKKISLISMRKLE